MKSIVEINDFEQILLSNCMHFVNKTYIKNKNISLIANLIKNKIYFGLSDN